MKKASGLQNIAMPRHHIYNVLDRYPQMLEHVHTESLGPWGRGGQFQALQHAAQLHQEIRA
jgi:hypothetical protein